MSDIMAFIGRRIRELREEQRLTTAQLADRLRIAEAHVQRLESGEGALPSKMLLRIAKALGVKAIRFFESDDDSDTECDDEWVGGLAGTVEVGVRIKQLREARGVKRGELARHLGMSEWQVERLERGDERPTLEILLRLAEMLTVKVVEFFESPWQGN